VLTAAAVFGGAALAPPALAAPAVTLVPICNDPMVPYEYSISLSGFPPGSQVGATAGGIGPAFFRIDSEGNLALGALGAFAPLGLVSVTVFKDLNENEAQDPGEPLFTGSLDRPCEELVFGEG
jgi:hypothetical protein